VVSKFGSKFWTFCSLVNNGEGWGEFLLIFMKEFKGTINGMRTMGVPLDVLYLKVLVAKNK